MDRRQPAFEKSEHPLEILLSAAEVARLGEMRRVPQRAAGPAQRPGAGGEGGRQPVGELGAEHRTPKEGPAAGHVERVVTATAENHPGQLQLAQRSRREFEGAGGELETGQRIAAHAVDADLGEEDIGAIGRKQRQHHPGKGLFEDQVVGVAQKRDIDRVAVAGPLPQFVGEPGLRVKVLAGLVQRDGQDPVGGVEGLLHPVAMMGIEVEIGDPQAPPDQGADGNRRVVEVAEAGGARRLGVVIAAGGVEGGPETAVDHQPGRFQGAAAAAPGPFVHPREDGIFHIPQAVAEIGPAGAGGAEFPQPGQVIGMVEGGQVRFGGQGRVDAD